jgi:hypothetical protein
MEKSISNEYLPIKTVGSISIKGTSNNIVKK